MDAKTLESICSQIYRQFPEVRDSHPHVTSLTDKQSLLVFSGIAKVAGGKSLPRKVRVVVDQNGRIIKTTTSR